MSDFDLKAKNWILEQLQRLDDAEREIVAYQIAKDNLELRLRYAKSAVDPDIRCEPEEDDENAAQFAPAQVY